MHRFTERDRADQTLSPARADVVGERSPLRRRFVDDRGAGRKPVFMSGGQTRRDRPTAHRISTEVGGSLTTSREPAPMRASRAGHGGDLRRRRDLRLATAERRRERLRESVTAETARRRVAYAS